MGERWLEIFAGLLPEAQLFADGGNDLFEMNLLFLRCDRSSEFKKDAWPKRDAQKYLGMVYSDSMRTNIDINESLVRKARKLTRLKTKRQIVDKALELLVRSESRKGILRYYGSGIWQGDRKAMRRNRV